jgi:hypothetical protein
LPEWDTESSVSKEGAISVRGELVVQPAGVFPSGPEISNPAFSTRFLAELTGSARAGEIQTTLRHQSSHPMKTPLFMSRLLSKPRGRY